MGRKKEYITELSKKDAKLAQCLYYSKTIKREDVLSIISKNRLSSYLKEGLIQKSSYKEHKYSKESRDDCYKLTEKGYSFFKKNYQNNFDDSKRYGGTSATHDFALAKELIKLSPTELESVRSELDCRDRIKEFIEELRINGEFVKSEELKQALQDHTISMPDCVYVDATTGQECCIEIVTSYYTEDAIEAKQAYCEVFNINYQQVKI